MIPLSRIQEMDENFNYISLTTKMNQSRFSYWRDMEVDYSTRPRQLPQHQKYYANDGENTELVKFDGLNWIWIGQDEKEKPQRDKVIPKVK